MFITTANQIETIPVPLLDRMEVIRISGYTENEKVQITKNYLIPRQLKENGLLPGEINFNDEAIQTIIRMYTREAGVRNLEREVGAVCRKIATKITEKGDVDKQIAGEDIRQLLGRMRYQGPDEVALRTSQPGVATGLAWTPVGGDILFIEATRMPGSKGFLVTGSIGNVMQESARAALSYTRSRAESLGIDPDFFEKMDIHLHIPAGAQPKDGPSAGVTMTTALVSLLTNRAVHSNVGMTGEMTLRGQVLPIGGLKEKILAAHRVGLKKVILPRQNEPDLEEIPDEVRRSMEFVLVEKFDEILPHALEPAPVADTTPVEEGNKNDSQPAA
jgi:ATP-dependent Lon protease